MKLYYLALITVLLTALTGCANYKLNYAAGSEDWQSIQSADTASVTYTLYLIGDIGDRTGKYNTGMDLLARHLRGEDEKSGVIFLGNNLSTANTGSRKKVYEEKLKEQLKSVRDFPGDIFFLPGESDWSARGLEGVEWEKDLIEDYLDRDDVWMPDPGCSGPEEIELTDDLVLLLVDSEWYLRDWEGEIDINSDCDVKSRKVFR